MPSPFIYTNTESVSIASAARTASGTGPATRVGAAHTVRAFLNVTAATGTSPSLTLTVETSFDGATGWVSVGSFTAATGVTSERKQFSALGAFVRFSWTITGTTPSITFSCVADLVGG